MDIRTIHEIKINPLLHDYLRFDSSWYKILNRNPESIAELERAAKKYFKLTFPDKLQKFVGNIEMISSFIDVLK